MTVADLIKWLGDRTDLAGVHIVVRDHDHHYRVADCCIEDGVMETRRSYYEWYPGEPGTPTKVLVID